MSRTRDTLSDWLDPHSSIMSLHDYVQLAAMFRSIEGSQSSEIEQNEMLMTSAMAVLKSLKKLLETSDRTNPAPSKVAAESFAAIFMNLLMAMAGAGVDTSRISHQVRVAFKRAADELEGKGN